MTAGVTRDPCRPLTSFTLVLPSGTFVDTAAPDAEEQSRQAEPALYAGLLDAGRADRVRPTGP